MEELRMPELRRACGKALKDIRKLARGSRKLRRAKVPLGALNHALAVLDLGVAALRDPEEQKAVAEAAGQVVAGALKSVATMSLSTDFLKGVRGAASLGVAKLGV